MCWVSPEGWGCFWKGFDVIGLIEVVDEVTLRLSTHILKFRAENRIRFHKLIGIRNSRSSIHLKTSTTFLPSHPTPHHPTPPQSDQNMSSLRNAVSRRNHKERAQPLERQKWGLLEKRKDYKLRAADHKSKSKKISALKAKASERNEDEFYFGMMSASSKGGVKVAKKGEDNGGGKALDVETVRLMKTQDAGYLRTALQRTRREIGRVGEEVVRGGVGVRKEGGGEGKVVFGEDFAVKAPVRVVEEDFDMDFLDEEEGSGEEDEDEDDEEDENLTPEEKLRKSRRVHALDVKRRKLEALRQQEDKLSSALEALEHQRAKMNHTIGGTNKAGVKFKTRERKR